MIRADFQNTLRASVADPSTKFTVSLDGVAGSSTYTQVMEAAQRGITGHPNMSVTDGEMGQLYQVGRLADTTFMRGGTILENPFAP